MTPMLNVKNLQSSMMTAWRCIMAKSKHKPALIDMMGLLLTTRSYALAINVGLGLAHLVEMQDAPYILAGLVETIIVLIATNAYLPVSEEMTFWRAMTVLNPLPPDTGNWQFLKNYLAPPCP